MGLNLVPAATTIVSVLISFISGRAYASHCQYVYTQTTVVFSQDAVLGTFCNNNVNLPASLDFE